MGKASSSKKVARAARAGTASRGRERRDLGFPLVLAVIVLLGSSLVLYARSTRSDAIAPRINTGAAGVDGDHWHVAYGIYNCDRWEEPITRGGNWPDSTGIHTHNDGVIHIHPFTSAASGTRARLKVFFETMGVKFNDDELELPNGTVLKSGTECNGKTAKLQVARFNADDPDAPPEIITDNLGNIRFLADREGMTIALVPEGEPIPPPETLTNIDALAGVDDGGTVTPPATAGDGSTPTTTAAAGTTPTTTAGGASPTTSTP